MTYFSDFYYIIKGPMVMTIDLLITGNPGSHFYVQYRKNGEMHFRSTREELNEDRWVVWIFWPQEGACEIPVPKWSYQGDALVSHLKFLNR